MSTAQSSPSTSDRVSWNQLIAYGMGGVVPIALFNIAGQLMSLLGNISLGLSAFWLGAIMFVPRLWEAFSDPVVGHLSDNTRTRWGRRRPYILIGALAVALSFVAMWWVPRGGWIREIFPSDWAYDMFQFAYILGGMLAFFTACAVFEIPHGALGLEMSTDYHERTRLFSAKSFLGNVFAMGTPALFLLAGLEFFSGPGGTHIDGMRFVSMLIALVLIPMAFWWFIVLREPGFAVAKEQRRTAFWHDMKITASNVTFLKLTAIVFTLSMGFNFVSNLGNYITIFYLYGGDTSDNAAGWLMLIIGWVWAITALVAVFPLNWISRRLGKNKTLIISILLMCTAQLLKIVCYNPQLPYLILIPTIFLSAGMLMFFTLGSSMVGDVCDEDELNTGTRSEGTYYSVFWWFIKVGTAAATLVAGALLVFTQFDEKQNVFVDSLIGNISVVRADAKKWQAQDLDPSSRQIQLNENLTAFLANTKKLEEHLVKRSGEYPQQSDHINQLIGQLGNIRSSANDILARSASLAAAPEQLGSGVNAILQATRPLKHQAPQILFRLRLVEIGLPLLLSIFSIFFCLRYPLTEQRCYEIKRELEARRAALTG